MDSSDEISDDVLTYLMENIRESDSSFVDFDLESAIGDYPTTDNDVPDPSETDGNVAKRSLVEPMSPSVKSSFSSRKLEWDSGADVGYGNIAGVLHSSAGFGKIASKLSRIERMALSSSASKLCFDEQDDQSRALVAKIDYLLSRGRRPPLHWFSGDSSGSAETIVPAKTSKKFIPLETRSVQTSPLPDSKHCEKNINGKQCTRTQKPHAGPVSKGKTQDAQMQTSPLPGTNEKGQRSDEKNLYKFVGSTPQYSNLPIQPVVMCGGEYAQQPVSYYPEPESFKRGSSEEGRKTETGSTARVPTSSSVSLEEGLSSQETMVSGSAAGSTRCSNLFYTGQPSVPLNSTPPLPQAHQTVPLKQQEYERADLRVYRNLRDHLDSLKNYVQQLERTWDFLDKCNAQSSLGRASRKSSVSTKGSWKLVQGPERLPSLPVSVYSSTCLDRNTARSDRSIEIERLNLNDTESDVHHYKKEDRVLVREVEQTQTHSYCCDHCSVKNKKNKIASKRMEKTCSGSGRNHRRVPSPKPNPLQRTGSMVAQREPLAFEVYLDDKPTARINVQAALQERRPDFVLSSEERRKAIQEMAYMRQVENAPFENIPRLFTYHQLRKHTEDIYQNLPETKKQVSKKVLNEKGKTNRVKANDFQKKLQSRVLQGQVNLPHTKCLLNSN